jgi:hypothetical protein
VTGTTFASLLIAQGAHPKLISEQLGHASVQIMFDRYGHLIDQSYGTQATGSRRAIRGERAGCSGERVARPRVRGDISAHGVEQIVASRREPAGRLTIRADSRA